MCAFNAQAGFANPSPSPRPSPQGRGRIVSTAGLESERAGAPTRADATLPLPEGEGWGEGEGGSATTEASARRVALIDSDETNCFRLAHGASDGWPGWYVERLGDYLLSQGEYPLTAGQLEQLHALRSAVNACGAYHKLLNRQVRRAALAEASPQLVLGDAAPERFAVRENGVQFELSFAEGYSVGLFLDQRDNRRPHLQGGTGFRNEEGCRCQQYL